MSGNTNDLNNFDLGLPEFNVPQVPAVEPLIEAELIESQLAESELAPSNAALGHATLTNAVKEEKSSPAALTTSAPGEPQMPASAKASAVTPKNTVPTSVDLNKIDDSLHSRRSIWSTVPSWLISTVVHVTVILMLAAWNFEPISKELKLMLVATDTTSNNDSLEEFAIDDAMASELESTDAEELPAQGPAMDSNIAEAKVDMSFANVVAANMPAVSIPSMTQSLIPRNGVASQANAAMRAGLNSRSKETKRDLLRKYGGSSDTEKAVSLALKWLAAHQDPQSGAWTLSHSIVCNGQCDHPGERRASLNAATGMALMCFLGAGQTHLEGEYKETVFKGLSFLIKSMKFQKGVGSWWVGDGGQGLDDMYAHGIATIAMCEAYGMTKDPDLYDAAQAGINYLTYAQNQTTGGWHYAPQGLGDTSVVGWQMMALKSGAMSGLSIDLDVVRKANGFLDQMAWDEGSSYHYDHNSVRTNAGYNPSTTACAVLCRMYSGMSKEHPSIKAAVKKFSDAGPSPSNTYYNYYATQVMKQMGGQDWENWNVKMRDRLVSTQVQSGHAAGSWYWDDGHSTTSGGRFYTTCMGTMMLEVYYRYMPLYGEQAEEDAFQL
jgi:hypothetical protein